MRILHNVIELNVATDAVCNNETGEWLLDTDASTRILAELGESTFSAQVFLRMDDYSYRTGVLCRKDANQDKVYLELEPLRVASVSPTSYDIGDTEHVAFTDD